jgi:hypothetical protein
MLLRGSVEAASINVRVFHYSVDTPVSWQSIARVSRIECAERLATRSPPFRQNNRVALQHTGSRVQVRRRGEHELIE